MPNRVFVVEDHEVYRHTLIEVLSQVNKVEVCGSSSTAEAALESLPEMNADIVIVDMSLPKMNGLEFAVEIKKRCPNLRCLMVSGHKTPALIERARELGLQGYVVKGDATQIKNAINDLIAGQSHFSVET